MRVDDDKSDNLSLRWHIDKSINLSHIIATVMIVVGLFVWGGKIDTRIAVLESNQVQMDKENRRQDDAANETSRLVRDELREVRSELRALRDVISNKGR